MNNMYFDPSVKKYRNTENISILSSKSIDRNTAEVRDIDFDTFMRGAFGFVIGENSFFPRTVLGYFFQYFFHTLTQIHSVTITI